MVVGEGLSSSPILTTTMPGVPMTTWGARTRMTTTTTTPPPSPPPRKRRRRPVGGGGPGRRGGGGEQGRCCDERDERDRSSGSAQRGVVQLRNSPSLLLYYYHTDKYLQISADICADIADSADICRYLQISICADIWSRREETHIGINMDHR